MNEYHKINSIFKRDQKGQMQFGHYSDPVFEYLKNNKWVGTEKVDGTNIRVIWNGESVSFGGKTDAASIPAPLVNRLNELFKTNECAEKFAAKFGEYSICLYGEGYGARIQKGGGLYKKDGQDFVLFDIKIGHNWLEREDVVNLGEYFNIGIVPTVGCYALDDAIQHVNGGLKSAWGDFNAEGLVLRPQVELKNGRGLRVITKIKHRDFAVIKRDLTSQLLANH